jgi:hypothetical protein
MMTGHNSTVNMERVLLIKFADIKFILKINLVLLPMSVRITLG